ncbi:MAG: DUF4249 family protein [Bacteroidota bacterium]
MNKFLVVVGICLLGLSACVTQIDTPVAIEPQLVINGSFNNSAGQRRVRVLLVEDLDGRGQVLDATGSIYKNGQLSAELVKKANGDLELPEGYMIEEGAEYFVEVVTNGDQVYRSIPQVVPQKLETEEVTWEVTEDIDRPTFRGDPIIRSTIEFFAHVTLPDAEVEKRYYRWVLDESWNYKESPISDTTCYLSNPITEYSASLLTNASNLLTVGEARKSIVVRDFDNSFAEIHYINVYLHSLDARTYEFYEKSERLTSGTGTIYDEVPGPFRGNVSNTANPEEVVLGWVEFFLADTLRARIEGDELRAMNLTVPTQCNQTGEPGPCPPQIPPPGGGLPPPCQCIDCQLVLGEDALNPPFYWEE